MKLRPAPYTHDVRTTRLPGRSSTERSAASFERPYAFSGPVGSSSR